jgi:uncharacterized protein YjdB
MTRLARASFLAAALLLACGDDLGPRVPAAIVVTPAAPRVAPADTLRLSATVVDAVGNPIDGRTVTFRSSDETVLTVDDAGLLTAVGSTGAARITAASGDITAEVDASVALPPSSVVVIPRSLELDLGQQGFFDVTVTDENGQPVPDAQFSVQVSDAAIVQAGVIQTSPAFGTATGLSLGTATLTVTSGGLSTDVPVTVTVIPAFAVVTPSSLVLGSGASQQVTAELLSRSGDALDLAQPFTWSSSNQAVVTVSPTGMVSSVGPDGSAIITATVDTFTAQVGVFVGTPPAGQKLATVEVDPARGAAVTPDGRYFVSSFGNFVGGQLPDFAFPFHVPIVQAANDVVVNSAGTRAYLIGSPPGVVVVDLATQAVVDSIPVHMGGEFNGALSGALSADGSILTVGTGLGFEVIDLATKASLGGTGVGSVVKLTHHPSRPLLYASGEAGVLELDDRSGAIIRRFTAPNVLGHVVSPDGTRVYAVTFGGGGGVRVWNLETGAPEPTRSDVRGTDVAISSDGRFLYVIFGAFDADNRLFILDAASGAVVRDVELGGVARRIALAPDGTAIITNENSVGGQPGWVDFVR